MQKRKREAGNVEDSREKRMRGSSGLDGSDGVDTEGCADSVHQVEDEMGNYDSEMERDDEEVEEAFDPSDDEVDGNLDASSMAAASSSSSSSSKFVSSLSSIVRILTTFDRIDGREHVVGKMIQYPIHHEHLRKLFEVLIQPNELTGRVVPQSTIARYVNAIKHGHQQANHQLPPCSLELLETSLHNHKQKISELRSNGAIRDFKGKDPISLKLYKSLSKTALFATREHGARSASVHCYIVLLWNLFGRMYAIKDLTTEQFTWENDALVICVPKSRAEMRMYEREDYMLAGENRINYLYANPLQPHICPILAIALHVFSSSHLRNCAPSETTTAKFFEKASYDRFRKYFPPKLLPTVEAEDLAGKHFGPDSFTTGVAEHVLAESRKGGHSTMSHTDTRSNRYSGRISSGLMPEDRANFAVLPPMINPDAILSLGEWKVLLPGYEAHNESFRRCLPFMLASLAYHYDWLTAMRIDGSDGLNISKWHPIFHTDLFKSGKILQIKARLLPLQFDKVGSHMHASGIPQHHKLRPQQPAVPDKLQQERDANDLFGEVLRKFSNDIESRRLLEPDLPVAQRLQSLRSLLHSQSLVQFATQSQPTQAPPPARPSPSFLIDYTPAEFHYWIGASVRLLYTRDGITFGKAPVVFSSALPQLVSGFSPAEFEQFVRESMVIALSQCEYNSSGSSTSSASASASDIPNASSSSASAMHSTIANAYSSSSASAAVTSAVVDDSDAGFSGMHTASQHVGIIRKISNDIRHQRQLPLSQRSLPLALQPGSQKLYIHLQTQSQTSSQPAQPQAPARPLPLMVKDFTPAEYHQFLFDSIHDQYLKYGITCKQAPPVVFSSSLPEFMSGLTPSEFEQFTLESLDIACSQKEGIRAPAPGTSPSASVSNIANAIASSSSITIANAISNSIAGSSGTSQHFGSLEDVVNDIKRQRQLLELIRSIRPLSQMQKLHPLVQIQTQPQTPSQPAQPQAPARPLPLLLRDFTPAEFHQFLWDFLCEQYGIARRQAPLVVFSSAVPQFMSGLSQAQFEQFTLESMVISYSESECIRALVPGTSSGSSGSVSNIANGSTSSSTIAIASTIANSNASSSSSASGNGSANAIVNANGSADSSSSGSANNACVSYPIRALSEGSVNEINGYNVYFWGDRFDRPFPEDFQFPQCSIRDICEYFRVGIPEQKIMPFRLISRSSLGSRVNQKFSKANSAVSAIVAAMREVCHADDVYALPQEQWDDAFNKAIDSLFAKFVGKLKLRVRDRSRIGYGSFYNILREYESLVSREAAAVSVSAGAAAEEHKQMEVDDAQEDD